MAELLAALVLFVGPAPPAGPTIAWGDAHHVWSGGSGGILVSVNGGATWRRQTRWPALQLTASDARHGWALSAQGITIRTTDGVHWRSLGVQHLLRIDFVDARHGFALGRDDFLLRTSDGGTAWRPAGGPQRLEAICFSDPSTGWVARGGSVWSTRNGARTWTRTTLQPARQGFPVVDLGCRGRDVWAVLHEGAGAGTEGYHVYRSLDGGSWRVVLASPFDQKLPHISNYSGPFAVVGHRAAVLEGSCAPCGAGTVTFVRTADGGRTFGRTVLRGLFPGPVAFADRLRGLVILTPTPRGVPTVWRTADGGRRWRPVLRSAALGPS